MELNQAVRRILGRHLILLCLCMSVGLGLGYLASANTTSTYSAETRLVLDTQDPTGLDEAQTIADTARAIVTSPNEVRVALRYAGVERSAEDVAAHDITVRALGSSGVLQLQVTDPSPRAAAVIANKLSDDLIQTRLAVSQGGYEQLHAKLQAQIQDLTAALEKTVRNIKGSSVPEPRALARQSVLQRQLAVAQTSLGNLEAVQAQRPKPEIIDRAEAPLTPDPSHWAKGTVLGGLAGLLIGLGLAALVETLRPSIVGAGAISRELGAPLLGEIHKSGDVPAVVAETARLAAIAADVRSIQLVAADPTRDLSGLAEAMQSALRHALAGTSRSRISPAPPRFRSFTAAPTKATDVRATGLVAALPSTVSKTDLEPLQSLLEITGYALIGIITFPRARWWSRKDALARFSPDATDTKSDESAPAGTEAGGPADRDHEVDREFSAADDAADGDAAPGPHSVPPGSRGAPIGGGDANNAHDRATAARQAPGDERSSVGTLLSLRETTTPASDPTVRANGTDPHLDSKVDGKSRGKGSK
jgi:capsular polysaccharide biosynthesis protein